MNEWAAEGPDANPAEAVIAALAAAPPTVVYVDDTPGNNGSVRCPSAPHTTIEAGIEAFTNLRIVGLGSPLIRFPLGTTSGFNINDSTNVTVQGLVWTGTAA